MSVQTKGKCRYCGKEYTKGYMLRHLGSCKERQSRLAAEKGSQKCGYFELSVYGKYSKEYWLIIEMREDAALTQVDEGAQHFYRKLGYKDCGGFVIDISGFEQPMEMFLIKSI